MSASRSGNHFTCILSQTALTMFALYNLTNRAYVACISAHNSTHVLECRFAGVPVATLPFHPFPFVHKVSHRGLEGDDFSQCSVVCGARHLERCPLQSRAPMQAFIYLLCQVGIRPVVGKLLGWGPSRAMNSITAMPPPSEQLAKMK